MASANRIAQAEPTRVERDEAIANARPASSDRPAAATAPAAAILAPASWADINHGLVAPNRCMWVVTVDAPFAPRGMPYVPGGSKPIKPMQGYTVVFDAASGEYQGTAAGPGSLNVLTGVVPRR